MNNCLKTALLLILLALSLSPAQAEEPGKLAEIRLMAEHGAVKPGDEIWIGIEQSIKPGWHTYWKNPGDSGSPPRITWKIPYAFTIGDIQWPAPKKIHIGALTNYGYEDNVILLQKLKVPRLDMQKGALRLTANTEILVCKDECIPEYGTFDLILNGPESDTEDNTNYFANAQQWIPEAVSWNVAFSEKDGALKVDIPKEGTAADFVKFALTDGMELFPEDWGLMVNNAKPEIKRTDSRLEISQKRDQRSLAGLDQEKFVLAFNEDGHRYAYALTAHQQGSGAALPMAHEGFFKIALLALLGGLVLNLMPCVFPILSIKALSLVKMSEKEKKHAQLHGLAYTAGVVLSFLFIASLLISLRAAGAEIGWGFQLQNPLVVTLLAYLLFVIGLNLCGLFEFSGHFGNLGSKLTEGEGLRNSFFTGILATLVATPCTAPFMATAIGAALLQPPAAALLIFAALGFGLALPYLVLSYAPALQKKLPRPGAWMEIFRQLLAFPMFASSAWLIWVLSQQTGPMGSFGALMGLVLIAFGIWLLRHTPQGKFWHYKIRLLALLAFIAAALMIPCNSAIPPVPGEIKTGFGEMFTPEKLQTALAGKDPVFVEMTAAWCITCKVNHAVAIDVSSTRKVFERRHVQYLVGDWTSQDAKITEYLNSFGRNGVPLYVFYGPKNADGKRPEPKVLPQLLTPGSVANVIEGTN